MGREAERQAIAAHIKAWWPNEFGPLAFPNQPFETPANSKWAAFQVVYYDTSRISLGKNDFLKRSMASLQFDLYTPQGTGTKGNLLAADVIEAHFEEICILTSDGEALQFATPEVKNVTGVDERKEGTNSNWVRLVVDCPFRRDIRVLK